MALTTSLVDTTVPQLYWLEGDRLRFQFHKYQKMAMRSRKRFILLLAGTQGGKTSFAPAWLHREIALKGAGDYLFVAPSYKLMNLKAIPEFLYLFQRLLELGEWKKADKVFIFSEEGEIATFGAVQETPTRVLFGHAQDPDSLESATAKAAVLDECGQRKFKLASFEAIMRRLSLNIGRVLMTTTPYYLGWLKTKFWDAWVESKGKHPELDVIRFPSIANPAFPREEYERARRDLPPWKFEMFYNAIFTRPAGLIYDCFDEARHLVKGFQIRDNWKRWYIGLDFGGVNTAAVLVVENPARPGNYVVAREYWTGNKTAKQHVTDITAPLPPTARTVAYGGASSEENWRKEFTAAGLPTLRPPISDVEVGINRVYQAFQTGILQVSDQCPHLLDELASYSREVDDAGEPTEAIENKHIYHLLDALRYIMAHLVSGNKRAWAW